jgi:xylulokinase
VRDQRAGSAVAGHLQADAASDLGLTPGIPVATGAGDAAAGAVGIGAINAGDGFVSLGTSGQLFVTTNRYRPNPGSLVHTYAHTLPGMWFQMACMLNGARPMAWLAELLNRPIADLLTEAATAPPGPLFLPYLTGERTPHGDTDIRAGFWGLGEDTSHGSLMRAVIEAIAFSFADAADALAAAGTRPDTLLAIGGGTRSDLLLQMIADVIDIPIGRSDGADIGPAFGAARLAQMALTGGDTAMLTKPEVTAWFTPSGHPDTRRLAAYRQLYPALKSVSAVLDTD